jgi:hypothetical protein
LDMGVYERLRDLKLEKYLGAGGLAVAEAILVLFLAQHHGWWPLGVLLVLGIELRGLFGRPVRELGPLALNRTIVTLVGLSAVFAIAITPRLVTQIAFAVLFGLWRATLAEEKAEGKFGLGNLLICQIAVFEAVFLMSAVWQTTEWLVVALVWAGSYLSVYSVLSERGEPAAGVMASVWAIVCAEISWVLIRWLFVYIIPGGYLLVPQPVVVLGALAYCFGSIYVSQRRGNLSRGRLTEYLLIGLILIAIVVTGTPWRGSL